MDIVEIMSVRRKRMLRCKSRLNTATSDLLESVCISAASGRKYPAVRMDAGPGIQSQFRVVYFTLHSMQRCKISGKQGCPLASRLRMTFETSSVSLTDSEAFFCVRPRRTSYAFTTHFKFSRAQNRARDFDGHCGEAASAAKRSPSTAI